MNGGEGQHATPWAAETRQALVRVLAEESRDALTRVSLAASELDRVGAGMLLGGRVDVIQESVAELESLLARIDRLTRPARVGTEAGASDLRTVFLRVWERVGASLRARGLELEFRDAEGPAFVALSTPGLETLCTGLLRQIASAPEADRALVELHAGDREAGLLVIGDGWSRSTGPGGESDETLREFEVAVAAAGGRLPAATASAGASLGFLIPRAAGREEVAFGPV